MRKLFLGVAVALVALAGAIPVLAASTIGGSLKLTTKQELASTGFTFDLKVANDTDGKPEPIKQFTVALPRGAKFDGRGAPRCSITNAEFMKSVRQNCAANTKVGQGTINATSDGMNNLEVQALLYNLKPVNKPANVADIAIAFELNGGQVTVLEATGKANKLVSEALKGEFPGGFRVTRFKGSLKARSKGSRSLITAPLKCPKSSRWTLTTTFTFPSGTSKRTSKSPCNHSRVR